MAQKRLGRGLDSLISNKIDKSLDAAVAGKEENVSRETLVRISDIEPNKGQPRNNFDKDALNELAESIKIHGIIQPIVVRKTGNTYEIIAGERRWRAARLAGLTEVPVLVRDYSEQEVYEVALIENIQRQNLNAIEEAVAYQKLIDEYNLKQDQVADRVGKSRTAVTNSLRLLKLEDPVKQMVIDNKLSAGHARALLGMSDGDAQIKLANKITDENLSVRQTEELIKKASKKANEPEKETKPEKDAARDPEYVRVEEELKHVLGTKVTIKPATDGKGKIEIEYYSLDELERLISQLGAEI
ncbi:MAG: ParB/RepB/Spo0J family partition protein [Lachnospiraceae bacterium]